MDRKTNWIGIVVSVVAAMLIGFLWYGVLFNQMWMDGNGITMEGEKMFKNGTEVPVSSTPMIFNTIAMVIYAFLMNWLLGKANANTWMSGATIGLIVGVINAMNVALGNMFAMNDSGLTVADGSYSVVLWTVMGAILGGLGRK